MFVKPKPRLYQPIQGKELYEEISWEEFHNTGLLRFVNGLLHIFGLALVLKKEGEGNLKGTICKTKVRGFGKSSSFEHYESVQHYMENSLDRLRTEVFDEPKSVYRYPSTKALVVATNSHHAALLLLPPEIASVEEANCFEEVGRDELLTLYVEAHSVADLDIPTQAIICIQDEEGDWNPVKPFQFDFFRYEGKVQVTALSSEWATIEPRVLFEGIPQEENP